uniref:Uncharacterized protein n=1 Tax=uncultured delta proteobacterium HF0130_20J24 TaxID=710829 RepID=E0XXR0_9DELT|nr:hypothetical protein [uncultured delta proteobacterium HF0130_20J24]
MSVLLAEESHLFPSRTQKLSPLAPMVLPGYPVEESVGAGPQKCALVYKSASIMPR